MGAAPPPTSPAVSRRMQLQRSRDTAPELALRRLLHRQGLRYRVHLAPIRGLRRTVDIVFGPARTIVEVRGCFWHGCDEHGTTPRANAEWWAAKIERNRRRGAETEALLRSAGWEVIVVWEHEDPGLAAARVADAVRTRRAAADRRSLYAAPSTPDRDPGTPGQSHHRASTAQATIRPQSVIDVTSPDPSHPWSTLGPQAENIHRAAPPA